MMKAARILCIPALWFVLTGCDQQAKTSSDAEATVDRSNPNGTPPPVVANDGDAKDQEPKADDSASTNDDPATQNDRPDPAKDNSPEPPDAIQLDNQAFETQLNKFRSFQEQGKFFEARKLVRSMQRDFADPARARELKEIEFQLKQLIREADGLEVAVVSLAAVDINEFQAARRLLKQGGEAGRILLRQIIRESDEARTARAIDLLVELNDEKTPELLTTKLRLQPSAEFAVLYYDGLAGLVQRTDPVLIQRLWTNFSGENEGPVGRTVAQYFGQVLATGANADGAAFDKLMHEEGAYRRLCNYYEATWRSGDHERLAWVRKYYGLINYITPGLRGEYFVRDDAALAAAQGAAKKAADEAKAATDARLAADQKSDAAAKAAAAAKTDQAKAAAAKALAIAQAAAKTQEAAKSKSDAAAKAAVAHYETPVFQRIDRKIDMPDKTFPHPDKEHNHQHISARWTGMIDIPETGEYEILCAADEYKTIKIDGGKNLVAATGGTHGATVKLTAGLHDIEVYFRQTTGGYYMHLYWTGAGFKQKLLDEKNLFTKVQLEK